MKKAFGWLLLFVTLIPCAYAQEVKLPYEEFIQLYDGDQIDFNGNGIWEKISYLPKEEEWSCSYALSVGDSRPVFGRTGLLAGHLMAKMEDYRYCMR